MEAVEDEQDEPPQPSAAIDLESSNMEATELEPVPSDLPSASVELEVEEAALPATTSSRSHCSGASNRCGGGRSSH